jgi:hypothetical protein
MDEILGAARREQSTLDPFKAVVFWSSTRLETMGAFYSLQTRTPQKQLRRKSQPPTAPFYH